MANQRKLIIVAALFVVAIGWFFFVRNSTDKSELPPAIYEKFGCGRITYDDRDTDKYCSNPKLWWDTVADQYGY